MIWYDAMESNLWFTKELYFMEESIKIIYKEPHMTLVFKV